MCVIMWVDKVRPTREMVEKAWNRNDDGGGVAYREMGEKGMEVVWKKGILSMEQMWQLSKDLPMPFVLHFRVASSGGIRQALTHPFEVSHEASIALEGRTSNYVLFHNGDWKEWDALARDCAIHSGVPIPKGRFSDSRAMAWFCSIYGLGFMEFLPEQRGILFGPHDMEFCIGRGWTEIGGVWCSNDLFITKPVYAYTMCRFPTCTRKDIDSDAYCPSHPKGVLKVVQKVEAAIPFSQAVPLMKLETAERLHLEIGADGKRRVSKNLIKRIRELYRRFEGMNPKQQISAERELRAISHNVLLNGPRT